MQLLDSVVSGNHVWRNCTVKLHDLDSRSFLVHYDGFDPVHDAWIAYGLLEPVLRSDHIMDANNECVLRSRSPSMRGSVHAKVTDYMRPNQVRCERMLC